MEDSSIDPESETFCIVCERNGNTTVFYPNMYTDCGATSEYISWELNTSVFSLEIHYSDLWMYVLYNNGNVVDRFNPTPNYWDINDGEMGSWKGNALTQSQYIPYLNLRDIERYLVRWDLMEKDTTAYPTDEYTY